MYFTLLVGHQQESHCLHRMLVLVSLSRDNLLTAIVLFHRWILDGISDEPCDQKEM